LAYGYIYGQEKDIQEEEVNPLDYLATFIRICTIVPQVMFVIMLVYTAIMWIMRKDKPE